MNCQEFKKLRQELKISLQSIANRVGTNKVSVLHFERGQTKNPRWDVAGAMEHMWRVKAQRSGVAA